MIDEITLKNLSTDKSLLFTKTPRNIYMLEDDGIDWDAAEASHNTYSNLTGIGNKVTSTKITDRTISITGRVCSSYTMKEIAQLYNVNTVDEINEKRILEIEAAKRALSQLINPQDYIRLSYKDYYIDGKPETSVKFSPSWKENNEIYCKFTFSLYCEDPLFKYKIDTTTRLSGVNGGFHFPVVIPKTNGMHFGTIMNYQLAIVHNTGDVALGGIIKFKANGTVKNPILTSISEDKSIQIVKTLQQDEEVLIDTTKRTVMGTTDGVTYTNYYQYWNFDNSWIQFLVGDTLLGFSADDETYVNLDVSIAINKSFYSMEAQ